MEQVIDEIDWPSRHKVVVKPNMVMPSQALANTHHDALAAVLEAVRARYGGPLVIAEGCALTFTTAAFTSLGLEELAAHYGAGLVDLNVDDAVPVTVFDRQERPLRLRMARHIVESDCRISLSLPKTHDVVLVSLSIKNMVMGSLVNRRLGGKRRLPAWQDRLGQIVRGHGNGWGSDKMAMHQGYPMININLALLAPLVWPHLSILDGFVAMEEAGPRIGMSVPWRIAVAGTDALAVDALTLHLMGFSVDQVGYLHYCAELALGCADLEAIQVAGNVAPVTVKRSFAPHPRHAEQGRWHHPHATRLLQHNPLAAVMQPTSALP